MLTSPALRPYPKRVRLGLALTSAQISRAVLFDTSMTASAWLQRGQARMQFGCPDKPLQDAVGPNDGR